MKPSLANIFPVTAAQHEASITACASMPGLSIKALIEKAQDLADFLATEKISVLGLYADNSPQWVIVDFACRLAEIALVPLPLFFSQQQLENAIRNSGLDAILSDQAAALESFYTPATSVVVDQGDLQYTLHRGQAQLAQNIPPACAKITFTSGSSGSAKGVCLSWQQQMAVAQSLVKVLAIERPRHLCIMPLSTLLENIAGVYAPLLADGEVIIPALADCGFAGSRLQESKRLLEQISKQAPATLIVFPELLQFLVQAIEAGWQAPASLQHIAVGGAKVSSAILNKAHSLGLPVYEGYGLSECASVVSINTRDDVKVGSCGRVLPHVEIGIQGGEIVVANNAFLGYLGDDSREDLAHEKVYTGDLGFIDHEGFLFIHGRKKNLLISSFGRNINPEWVESELLALPSIAQAIVVGDAKPYCSALIYPAQNHISDIQIQNQIDHVNRRLPDYAQVLCWYRLKTPLDTTSGLLTENARPVRARINVHYAQAIESMYEENSLLAQSIV